MTYHKEISSMLSQYSPHITLARQLRSFRETGLICCGGRIHNARVSERAKCPHLLPPKAPFTELVATLISVNCMLVWVQLWPPYTCDTGFLPDVSMSRTLLTNVSLVSDTVRFQDYHMSICHPRSTPISNIKTIAGRTIYDRWCWLHRSTTHLWSWRSKEGLQLSLQRCHNKSSPSRSRKDLSVQTFLLVYRRFAARISFHMTANDLW